MPTLYIKCPITGKLTPTGISVPINSNLENIKNNKVKCPHCEQMHEWNGVDAFFLDDKGRQRILIQIQHFLNNTLIIK